MKQLAAMPDALPLVNDTFTYSGKEVRWRAEFQSGVVLIGFFPHSYFRHEQSTTTWDEEKIFGCHCDSSWAVGLGSGETQAPEWFGYDCSQSLFTTKNSLLYVSY